VGIVAACTALAALMERHFAPANLTMIYLLGVVLSGMVFGRKPAVLAAVLSVLAFDFAFVPPRFTLRVDDTQYLVTFGVMLVVAIVAGSLTASLREQREEALLRERRTATLHRLSRDLVASRGAREVAATIATRIGELLGARVAISLPVGPDALAVGAGDASLLESEEERTIVRRVFENRVPEPLGGAGSGTTAAAPGLHLPLEAGATLLGVLTIQPADPATLADRERFHLLRALANQAALALERVRLAGDVERARLEAEAERTRSTLLSSVSHDLRTPLASIVGAATTLRDASASLSGEARAELADTIAEEAERLDHRVGNLLEMARLESKSVQLRKSWHSLEELVGAALARFEPVLGTRPVRVSLPADLPLVELDALSFEQVITNLIENVLKYTPDASPLELGAEVVGSELRFDVADHGPGLAPGESALIFEKFQRGASAGSRPGAGLGLAICRAIVRAHGGRIEAAETSGGGARFSVFLPLSPPPSHIPPEPEAGQVAGRLS
jgi:two-component system sensor histidine kinase KdpD